MPSPPNRCAAASAVLASSKACGRVTGSSCPELTPQARRRSGSTCQADRLSSLTTSRATARSRLTAMAEMESPRRPASSTLRWVSQRRRARTTSRRTRSACEVSQPRSEASSSRFSIRQHSTRSAPGHDVLELPRALNEARAAMEAARRLGTADPCCYDELGVVRLLVGGHEDPDLKAFVAGVTQPLLDYDAA